MGNAASLFNGNNEPTLHSRLTPNSEQREFLQEHWNQLADHLKEKLKEKYDFPISTWLQGSYKYGTLIKPITLHDSYDVDVGLYFLWNAKQENPPSPKALRDWVQTELLEYEKSITEIKKIESPPKPRCSRVIFKKQFHIDIPVYHLDSELDKRRLACIPSAWENSDPKQIYQWFKTAVPEGSKEQFRRLIRYMKGWASMTFHELKNSKPSSILLTVWCADAFNERKLDQSTYEDDDALAEIIEAIYLRIISDRHVPNPVDRQENLNRISSEAWPVFREKLRFLYEASRAAKVADDEDSAALEWAKGFSYLMPLPEASTTQTDFSENAMVHVPIVLPEIQIAVYSRNPRRLLGTYLNGVENVPKDSDLEFSITNRSQIPLNAIIHWTVRNDGDEAADIGDLGHHRSEVAMFTANEHTAYVGTHFMDCLIERDGAILALRRVPVTIIDSPSKRLQKSKPPYYKQFTNRRRR